MTTLFLEPRLVLQGPVAFSAFWSQRNSASRVWFWGVQRHRRNPKAEGNICRDLCRFPCHASSAGYPQDSGVVDLGFSWPC